jgi:hypothetical protein
MESRCDSLAAASMGEPPVGRRPCLRPLPFAGGSCTIFPTNDLEKQMINIPIAKTVSIREAGFDEHWLHEQIINNPSALGLGDLEVISKEKTQASGGRLDILLKDPEDDKMYEVEVMLGETDESHIIRTIEYWDNEKRKFPQRQHHAVLVAEKFSRRYFNVIQLFSHAIPITAVQAYMTDVAGQKALHFLKVLDTYEEPDDLSAAPYQGSTEQDWREDSAWTLEAANTLREIIKQELPTAQLHYLKYYIAISVNGDNYIWLHKRGGNKSQIGFWFSEKYFGQASEQLEKAEISYSKKNQQLYLTTDSKTLKNHATVMLKLAEFCKLSWAE